MNEVVKTAMAINHKCHANNISSKLIQMCNLETNLTI